MTRKVVGSIVNTVGFEIDKRSWKNLNQFQQRIRGLKKDMEGLSGGLTFSVRGGKSNPVREAKVTADAHIRAFERVQNTKIRATKEVAQTERKISRAATKDAHVDALRAHRVLQKKQSHIDDRRGDVNIAASRAGKLSPAAITTFKKKVDELGHSYKTTAMSSAQYNKSLNRLNSNLRRQSAQVKTLNQRFLDLRHNMIGLGVVGAGVAGVFHVVKTGQAFESAGAKMLMATGNATDAAEGMSVARREAKRLGLDLLQTTDAFARLGIAAEGSMDRGQVEDLFVSFSELGTAAKIPKVQMDRGMRAMEQMLNKGQLMAEEVKGQFAEAIPGGLKVFSRALGMTTKEFFKAMEAGDLLAADVLPLVAKEMAKTARNGGALTMALKSNQVAMGQMNTEWQELTNIFFTSGINDLMTAFFHSAAELAIVLKPLADIIGGGLAKGFFLLVSPILLVTAALADFVEWIGGDTIDDIDSFTGSILEVGVALLTVIAGLTALGKLKSLFGGAGKLLGKGKGVGGAAKASGAGAASVGQKFNPLGVGVTSSTGNFLKGVVPAALIGGGLATVVSDQITDSSNALFNSIKNSFTSGRTGAAGSNSTMTVKVETTDELIRVVDTQVDERFDDVSTLLRGQGGL